MRRFRRCSCVAVCIALLASPVLSDDMSQWAYKAKLEIPGYDRSEALANYPLLVTIGTNIPSFQYADCGSPADGGDIRFADKTETTILNYEMEEWDTNGYSCAWVQIAPALTNGTTVWMYWGNTNAAEVVPPPYTTNGATWDSTFLLVMHLNHTNGAPDRRDSTSAQRHRISGGGVDVDGVVAHGQHGGPMHITNDFAQPSSFSVTAWFKLGSGGAGGVFLAFNGGAQHNCYRVDDSRLACYENYYSFEGSTRIPSDEFYHHAAITKQNTATKSYVDGQFDFSKSAGTPHGTADEVGVGGDIGHIGSYGGDFDEFRVANVVRSSNWIWACCASVVSNMTFVDPVPWISNANGATNVTGSNAWLNGRLEWTSSAPCFVSVYWGPTDGGGDNTAWVNTNHFGVCTPGDLTTNVFFGVGGTYYYRFRVTNAVAEAWASPSLSFISEPVGVVAGKDWAHEAGPVPGTFSVFRPITATNSDLVVNYVMSDTAVNGVDYVWLPGSVTIPAGQTNVEVSVIPIEDVYWDEDTEFARLTLSSGGYLISSQNTAVVSIDNSRRWDHTMPITFPIYEGADLDNFPILIVFSEARIEGFKYNDVGSPYGYDLRFMSGDETTELSYEIAEWNTNGESYVWVKLPTLSEGPPDPKIFATWGNNAITSPPSYCTNGDVWSESFFGVWHLDETNGLVAYDSGPDKVHADAVNCEINDWTNGIVVNCIDLGGTDEIVRADFLNLPRNEMTHSVWVKLTDNSCGLMSVSDGGSDWMLYTLPNDTVMRRGPYWWEFEEIHANVNISDGNWHYLTHVYGPSIGGQKLYIDGKYRISGAEHTSYIGSPRWFIVGHCAMDPGYANPPARNYMTGMADEARLSSVVRSADWIWASYLIVASNDTFCAFGPVESWGGGTVISVR